VAVDAREECHWTHTYAGFKPAGVRSNMILTYTVVFENEHRAPQVRLLLMMPGKGAGRVYGWEAAAYTRC
jgi:hypothetical protein